MKMRVQEFLERERDLMLQIQECAESSHREDPEEVEPE